MMTDEKETLMRTFKPRGYVVLHEDNTYASSFLRIQSLAAAHFHHIWGKNRDTACYDSNAQKKQSCSFTINAKALCLSEKSIFPLVLHCINGRGICISK